MSFTTKARRVVLVITRPRFGSYDRLPQLMPPPIPGKTTVPSKLGGVKMPSERRALMRSRHQSRSSVVPPQASSAPSFCGTRGGGINWGSLSYEPKRGLVITNTTRLAFVVKLIPRVDRFKLLEGVRPIGRIAFQGGTPYLAYWEPLLGPRGAPCNPPPWGTLVAVD